MTHSTSTPGSKVGRARRSLGQLWQVPMFLFGVLAFVGVAASTPWRLTPQEREFDHFVTLIRQGLESNEAGDVLVGHAENLQLRLPRFPARGGEANFLIGSAYYRQALQKPPAQAKAIWMRAAEHLDKALAGNTPPADRPALQYRLGYTLYQQNRELPRALELMMQGVDKGAEQPLLGYQVLVKGHMQKSPPDLDGARAAIRRVIDLTPERDIEGMAAARLQHADLLIRKEMRADALKELERIGPKAPRGLRIKARLLQARCLEDDGQWKKAISIWQELAKDAAEVDGGMARICYALGWCYRQMDPPDHAEAIRAWSEALKLGGDAGQAAGLRLGQLRLSAAAPDAARALADWKTALEKVNNPKDYRNPYIAIEEVRGWFDAAIEQFQDAQDPEKTQIVAELYGKIAPGGGAQWKIAEAAEARAKQLADKRKMEGDKVPAIDVQAQYRRAGEAWELAAATKIEAERSDTLWRGVRCYLRAKDHARVQQLLEEFVKLPVTDSRLAEALLTRGDLYRLDQQKNLAHKAYVECIECGKTPFAYRARFWLAVEQEIDYRDLDKARSYLQDNLSGDFPGGVERDWHEKSAFKMASLLVKIASAADAAVEQLAEKRQKNPAQVSLAAIEAQQRRAGAAYGEALIHLKDCLHNFPENPNTLLAREQLGQCYCALAERERLVEKELLRENTGALSEEQTRLLKERISLQQEKRLNTLKDALKTYVALADELEKTRVRNQQLTKLEASLLRRARYGIGMCYFSDERYDEAKVLFRDLQRKHRGTLESFVASVYLCKFIELPTGNPAEVRETAKESIRLLLEDLKSIPPDDDMFRLPGVTSHANWLRWAQDTQRLLNAPPAIDSGRPAFGNK